MFTSINISIVLSLIYAIACQTQHSNFNAFLSDNQQTTFGSNNEFAELASNVYDQLNSAESKRMQALLHVLGHLPFTEQIAFIQSIDTTSAFLFSKSIYWKKIRTPNTNTIPSSGQYTTNLFAENTDSISKYITESVKRLSNGLGGIKRIVNKYGNDSSNDEEKVSHIYSTMNELFKAQTQANYCSANFLFLLQRIMMQRRGRLFTLKHTNINIDPETLPSGIVKNPEFIYEDETTLSLIVGMKYTINEQDKIIAGFKNYSTCMQTFSNILHTKVMDIIIEIGYFRNCFDREVKNGVVYNSFQSSIDSDTFESKLTANTQTSMIRSNNPTTSLYSESNQYVRNYPDIFNHEFFKELINTINADPALEDLKQLLIAIQTPSKQYRPYSNLHSIILNTNGIVTPNDQSSLNKCLQYLNDFEANKIGKGENLEVFFCEQGSKCDCLTVDCSLKTNDFDFTIRLNKDNNNFHFTNIKIFIIFQKDDFPILITEAENPLTGKIFDMYYKGNGLGNQTMETSQSCFGNFTSGFPNERDKCRNAILDTCEVELDNNCKLSGLYDYINETPVLSNALPFSCIEFISNGNYDKEKCFIWIDKHFILGTIAIKPSAFISYNLDARASFVKTEKEKIKEYYKPAEIGDPIVISSEFEELFNDVHNKKMIYVFGSVAEDKNSIGDSKILVLQADLSNTLLELSSSELSYRKQLFLLVYCIVLYL